jgi:beta-lactamase class A
MNVNEMRKIFYISICMLILSAGNSQAQKQDLLAKVKAIAAEHPANIGFAAMDLQSGKLYEYNGRQHFPMHSVYKFHLALAVLNQVDQGIFKLDQRILIEAGDLNKDTWSPIRDKYPEGGIDMPLSELLYYTVALSDNNGCDILFKLIGGAPKVTTYMHKLGIKEVNIAATENEMKMYDKAQYTNWTTPRAACDLLNRFDKKMLLSAESQESLRKTMGDTTRGNSKIRGQLPKGTPVAHKTGYSGVNNSGITTATNDIGIVTLPDGKRFAIAVFVTMTREPESINESTIAALARTCWDYFK